MRRTISFFDVLIRQLISDIKVNVVIICTLTLTFTFIFLVSTEFISRISEYGEINEGIRTYEIRSFAENSISAFDTILKEFEKKNIEKITFINLTANKSEVPFFNLFFNSEEQNYLNPENMEKQILLGRDFNKNEISNGENVVILSENDYSLYYKNYNIGDNIKIADYDFKLIGVSNNNDEKISSVIPFNTLVKLSSDNKNTFHINEAFITLNERISKKETRNLIKAAQENLNNVEYHINTSSSWMILSKLENVRGIIFATIIVIVFCIFNIINLLKILHYRNKSIMKLYRNLGYEDKYIALTFVSEVFILISISCIVGFYLFVFFDPFINEELFIR